MVNKTLNFDESSFQYIDNGEGGVYKFENNFSLKYDEVLMIGLVLTLIVDTEVAFLTFVTRNSEMHSLAISNLERKDFERLLEKFNIQLNIDAYSFEDHEANRSIVLFPQEFEGEEFLKRENIFFFLLRRFLAFFKFSHIAKGKLSPLAQSLLKK